MSAVLSSPAPEVSPPGLPEARPLFFSLARWLGLYLVALILYNVTYPVTSGVMIHRLQVVPAVRILEFTLPETTFLYHAATIRTQFLEMQILRGCDGVEAWLMLVAALLVFPMPWRHRCWGIFWGTALVFTLNLIRIVSLFHLVLRKPEWFDMAHGMVWQSLMVLGAAAFALAWLEPVRMRHGVGEKRP